MKRTYFVAGLCTFYIIVTVLIIITFSYNKKATLETIAETPETTISNNEVVVAPPTESSVETPIETPPAPTEILAPEIPEKTNGFPVPYTNIIYKNVHIRDKASMLGKIIGRTPPFATGEILEIVDSEWAKVTYKGLEGYSAYRYFDFILPKETESSISESQVSENKISENKTAPPSDETNVSTEEDAEKEKPVLEPMRVEITSGCYIRSSTDYNTMNNVIGVASKDELYPLQPEKEEDAWYCIILKDGNLGYINKDYAIPFNS